MPDCHALIAISKHTITEKVEHELRRDLPSLVGTGHEWLIVGKHSNILNYNHNDEIHSSQFILCTLCGDASPVSLSPRRH